MDDCSQTDTEAQPLTTKARPEQPLRLRRAEQQALLLLQASYTLSRHVAVHTQRFLRPPGPATAGNRPLVPHGSPSARGARTCAHGLLPGRPSPSRALHTLLTQETASVPALPARVVWGEGKHLSPPTS